AGGHRQSDRRPAADPAGGRTHRKPRLEDRRLADGGPLGTARGRRDRLPGHAQPELHLPRPAPPVPLRRETRRSARRVTRATCYVLRATCYVLLLPALLARDARAERLQRGG